MDRRSFLKAALALAITLHPIEALSREKEAGSTLRMYNTHTEEHVAVKYRDGSGYIPESLDRLDHLLRCHYNGKVHKIDPGLYDMLASVDKLHGGGNTLHIISGYRSPEYNAIIASRSGGVARKSLHLQGMAIDFRIPGVGMKKLYNTVRTLQAGGAGIYSEFVHMDTGRVRYWGKNA